MANKKALKALREGVDAWRMYVASLPAGRRIDLQGADLRGLPLDFVNFENVDLQGSVVDADIHDSLVGKQVLVAQSNLDEGSKLILQKSLLLLPDTVASESIWKILRDTDRNLPTQAEFSTLQALIQTIRRKLGEIGVIGSAEWLPKTPTIVGAKHRTAPPMQLNFAPGLTSAEIVKTLAALADLYRIYGGTGLVVDFDEVDVREGAIVGG